LPLISTGSTIPLRAFAAVRGVGWRGGDCPAQQLMRFAWELACHGPFSPSSSTVATPTPRPTSGPASSVTRCFERITDEYEVSDPTTSGTPLYFMNVPEPKAVKNRLHIDITTDEALEEEVA
jgi:hypothetical protein